MNTNTNTNLDLIAFETCFGDGDDCDAHVAECVAPDGRTTFWLIGNPDEGQTPVRPVEHEQLGPLPWHVRARIDALPAAGRCNAPTVAGTPCRKTAAGCPFHRAAGAAS